ASPYHSTCNHRDLHSSPTRRSSDLSNGCRSTPSPSTEWTRKMRPSWISKPTKRSTMEAPAPVAIPGRTQPATANEQPAPVPESRSEEHTSELQSRENLVCRLLLEKK